MIDILISQNLLTRDFYNEILSRYFNFPLANLKAKTIDPEIINLLPESFCRAKKIISFDKDKNGVIYLAMSDPTDIGTIEYVEKYAKSKVKTFLESPETIERLFASFGKRITREFKKIIEENIREAQQLKGKKITEIATEVPIVNLFDGIISFALSLLASDIHIESLPDTIMVRFRIDGLLREIIQLPFEIHPALVARVKLLSDLKIDEHYKPQDGRFRFTAIGGALTDIRVAIMPTVHGEKIVLRLLIASAKPLSLAELGMSESNIKNVEGFLKKPYGIILICGPTGSGKTTTIYSMLSILNKPEVNIITIEDPVEYEISYINQTQINPQAGITFATGLRAILRQDPNIIVVGEIRDSETAEIATHAALTGHLVLSSLHTNDAPTTIPRLIDLNIPPFLVSASINAIIAQRLVRKICKDCIESYRPSETVLETIIKEIKISSEEKSRAELPTLLFRGRGCRSCNGLGYQGRVGIFEILVSDDEIRNLIVDPVFTLDKLRGSAKKKSMKTMFEDGLEKAALGITTIEEILRVIKE